MAVTPEGKIKKMVRDVLGEFNKYTTVDDYSVGTLKQYWPVPAGFGASDLDCIVCYYGRYIAIETKASGEKPTPRQKLTIAQTLAAGGFTLVIDSKEGCEQLRLLLQGLQGTPRVVRRELLGRTR